MGNNFHYPKSPIKRNGKKFYHQGFYELKNKQKYIGDPTKVIYRSKWEFQLMAYFDTTDKIKRWSSEFIVIPYQDSSGKIHKYFPDFYIEIIDPNYPDKFECVVVELKPKHETIPPKVPEKVTAKSLENYEYALKTYQKNLYKWTRAIDFCKKHQYKFVIVHEDYLKEKNIM